MGENLWRLQPIWFRRLRLFTSIVWREWHGPQRLSVRLAWKVACCIYPITEDPR